MKIRIARTILAAVVLGCTFGIASGQGPDYEQQIRVLVIGFEQSWNKHDMKALFAPFTEDADFVNVAGRRWKGRGEIQSQHEASLSRFAESRLTIKGVTVALVKPDVALAHVTWGLTGDKNPDGTAREPREGIFTWVVVKQGGAWMIRAAQNTNISAMPQPANRKQD